MEQAAEASRDLGDTSGVGDEETSQNLARFILRGLDVEAEQ